ncbi:MAG: tyrosinase family protein [Microvirga sp.]
MEESIGHGAAPSRRDFLSTTGAALAAAVLPSGSAVAQSPAKHRRVNVSSPEAGQVLASYKKAIRAMLALPPSDPRNWYRQSLVHTLDCPHGNWWFLVWHRGYVGWFEQICRELSGDPQFALPYWDWSENLDSTQPFAPRVPAAMFDDVLTPTDSAFIASFNEFKKQFGDVVAKADYWKVSNPQYEQLLARGIRFPEDLWFDINDDPRGTMFFDRADARGLTKSNPFLDERTKTAVSATTLTAALRPTDFITFGSPKTFSHSGLTGFGVLEGQPHNRVHNNVGGIITTTGPDGKPVTTFGKGFMQANLSPVDPLFFLHHANIDRIWDVWTRKQQALGLPILPDGYLLPPGGQPVPGTDYFNWSGEPFLFFIDAKGQPVSKTAARDYESIGDFAYDYQPGSGEGVVPKQVAAAPQMVRTQAPRFSAQIGNPIATASAPASGVVALPSALLQVADGPNAPVLLAKITLALPPLAHSGDLAVVVNAPGGDAGGGNVIPLSMFGHHIVQAPVTFTVPLGPPVAALRANNRLAANTLNFSVAQPAAVAMPTAHAHGADARVEVLSIVVEAH